MGQSMAYVIEVQDETVGIVVAEGCRGYMFFSSERAFHSLDRRVFSNVAQARKAANTLASGRGAR